MNQPGGGEGRPVGWLKSSRDAEERGCTFSHRGESRFPRLRRSRLIRPFSWVHFLLTCHPRGSLRCPPPPTPPSELFTSQLSPSFTWVGSSVLEAALGGPGGPRGRVEVLSSISTYVGDASALGGLRSGKSTLKKKKIPNRQDSWSRLFCIRTLETAAAAAADLNHSRRRSVQACRPSTLLEAQHAAAATDGGGRQRAAPRPDITPAPPGLGFLSLRPPLFFFFLCV